MGNYLQVIDGLTILHCPLDSSVVRYKFISVLNCYPLCKFISCVGLSCMLLKKKITEILNDRNEIANER